MNARLLATLLLIGGCAGLRATAQQSVTPSLEILDEKVNRLRADIDDLQFRQKQTEDALKSIKSDLAELRKNSGTASADDLHALEARVQALDAARQKDKQVIIDQIAKELAALGSGPAPKSPGPKPAPDANTKEYIVQKGEYLAVIARKFGVSITDLKKANNLPSNDLQAGQKLVIPDKH